jgi:hypothetical protein
MLTLHAKLSAKVDPVVSISSPHSGVNVVPNANMIQ